MTHPERTLAASAKYPYAQVEAPDWAMRAALAIAYDLCDRRGIKHEMTAIDEDVRLDLVAAHADIIRAALASSPAVPSLSERMELANRIDAIARSLSYNGEKREGDAKHRLREIVASLGGTGALAALPQTEPTPSEAQRRLAAFAAAWAEIKGPQSSEVYVLHTAEGRFGLRVADLLEVAAAPQTEPGAEQS